MQEDTYKTIQESAEAIYTEKRSKFIAIALPVRTLSEVKSFWRSTRRNITMPATCVMPICWVRNGKISGLTTTESLRHSRKAHSRTD